MIYLHSVAITNNANFIRSVFHYFHFPTEMQKDSVKGELYAAFNTSHVPVTIQLPERQGYKWEPLVDTGKETPYDFLTKDLPERDTAIKQYRHFLDANLYPMLSYSSIVLLLVQDD